MIIYGNIIIHLGETGVSASQKKVPQGNAEYWKILKPDSLCYGLILLAILSQLDHLKGAVTKYKHLHTARQNTCLSTCTSSSDTRLYKWFPCSKFNG